MLKNIDLFNPDFVIDCSQLKNCRDIYAIMRHHGIVKSYAYGMCFKPGPLTYDFSKVGMSSPSLGNKREHQVGERITRQLSWVPGWEELHVRSSHGADFWGGIEHHLIPQGILPASFNKNDVTIAVWDVSKRMILSDIHESDELKATAWAEGELAKQYKDIFGRLPYLNVQDPTNTKHYRGGYIPKSVYDLLGLS